MSKKQILNNVSKILKEVVGEDWIQDIDIDLGTSFNDDLELESIEFVALAESLQNHYGDNANFIDWLSTKELEEIIGLKVGDLVEFLEDSISIPS